MNGFLGSRILEAAIGLAVIYLTLAVFCSTANEWIAMLMHARAANLRTALQGLLDNQDAFADAFYKHPLITSLAKNGFHPAWMPPRIFSHTVIDLVACAHGIPGFEELRNGILNLPEGDVRTALLALIRGAEGDLHKAQANIETWFNDAMDRASAWYKRRAQLINAGLAAIITIALNADTIAILHRLWAVGSTGTLLGWDTVPATRMAWAGRVSGWLLTVAAVSLGAPFWFDVIQRLSSSKRK